MSRKLLRDQKLLKEPQDLCVWLYIMILYYILVCNSN